MAGETERSRNPVARRRLLLRGESAVAVLGIALTIIFVTGIGAGVAWVLSAERDAVRTAQENRVQTVGALVAQSATALLAHGETAPVRRLVADAGREHGFAYCRLVLPDGQVIADADPSQITLLQLPARWLGPFDARPATGDDRRIAAEFPIDIADRGPARLEIAATVDYPALLGTSTQAGLVLIGAAALAAVLLVYRHTRNRLAVLSAIRESLLAIQAGEDRPTALGINPNFGHEAAAWNRLLDDREQLHRQTVLDHARDRLTARKGTDLHGACDALSQGLILIDERLTVRYANGAASVFLQTQRDQLIGAEVTRFIDDERVVKALRESAGGELRRRCSIEVQSVQGHGEKGVLRYHVRPVRREDYAAAMIIIEDVTQQRVADESRHQFVAQATHELRTPLTNIRLYVETALEEGESDATLRAKCLNVINQESMRLERIVTDMLSIAEIEAGSLQVNYDDVRLDAVLGDLLADFQKQAESKGIVLAFNIAPKLPVLQADRDKLQLAMQNLVGNALKYTLAGGRVAVNVDADDDKVVMEVRDTGIGISADDQQRVFDKFYRAHDRRIEGITGTGLGLALAREVVRLHGGDITVESEIDKGSTFTMTIPTRAAAA